MTIRQAYARKQAREEIISKFCPTAPRESGIYVFYRDDVSELKFCYVGQALHLLDRMAAHLGEYDHIGLSLKKRGFYREDNPYGWKITFKTCPQEDLNKNERLTIKAYADKGFQLYNITAGGQDKGKVTINRWSRRPPKKYREGILRGKRTLAREIRNIIDKYLEVNIRDDVTARRAAERNYKRFFELIKDETYNVEVLDENEM